MLWVQTMAAYGAAGTIFLGDLLVIIGLSRWPQSAWTPFVILLTAVVLICVGLMALVSLAQALLSQEQQ
jgi:hypothetical protein